MNAIAIKLFIKKYAIFKLVGPVIKCVMDRRYFYYYLQRRVTNLKTRRRLASIEAQFFGKRISVRSRQSSSFADQLLRDGYTDTFKILSKNQLDEILEHLSGHSIFDPHRPQYGMFSHLSPPADTHVGHYLGSVVASAPNVLNLANHPLLIQAVSEVFGCKPVLDYVGCWWSFPGKSSPEEQQLFHRDLDTLQFIKFFLYLTDVDENSGPHVYVRGSHQVEWKVSAGLRISDEQVYRYFSEDSVIPITGSAGTSFLENTFGVHKGVLPVSKPRLILQFIYAVTRTPYFTPKKGFLSSNQPPFDNPSLFDPDINKFFLR